MVHKYIPLGNLKKNKILNIIQITIQEPTIRVIPVQM